MFDDVFCDDDDLFDGGDLCPIDEAGPDAPADDPDGEFLGFLAGDWAIGGGPLDLFGF